MTIAVDFEISEDKRAKYININIIDVMRNRINSIINNYAGLDADALSILKYASERGRLDEFAERLERHFCESLSYVDPEVRGAHEGTTIFFRQCYGELGIRNRNSVA